MQLIPDTISIAGGELHIGREHVPGTSIVSMHTIGGDHGPDYVIVTSRRSYPVLLPQGYSPNQFEAFMLRYADLCIAATAPPLLATRWTKKGRPYTHSGFFDRLNDDMYGINSREARVATRLGLFLFFATIILTGIGILLTRQNQ